MKPSGKRKNGAWHPVRHVSAADDLRAASLDGLCRSLDDAHKGPAAQPRQGGAALRPDRLPERRRPAGVPPPRHPRSARHPRQADGLPPRVRHRRRRAIARPSGSRPVHFTPQPFQDKILANTSPFSPFSLASGPVDRWLCLETPPPIPIHAPPFVGLQSPWRDSAPCQGELVIRNDYGRSSFAHLVLLHYRLQDGVRRVLVELDFDLRP
jgi:hypothetical protein